MAKKKDINKAAEKQYYEDAAAWDIDRERRIKRSERVAWMVAVCGVSCALVASIAVMLLTPLKTVQPFVIRVDKATGIVNVVRTMKPGPTTYNEAITRYFLTQYIHAREGYSRPLAESNFDKVSLMSDTVQRHQYVTYFDPIKNPRSPLNIYNTQTTVETKIKSISFLKQNTAAVRYLRIQRTGTTAEESNWIATITFRYVNGPETEQAREINPLGFLVIDYRTDPETLINNADNATDDSTVPVPLPGQSHP